MYCNIDVNRWKNTEAVSVSLQDIEVFFSIDIDIRQGISTTIFSLKIEEILWKKCRFIKIIMILKKMFSPNCGKAQMWDQTLWLSRKWTMCTNWHCQEGKAGLFKEGLIHLRIGPDIFIWKCYWWDGSKTTPYVPKVSTTVIQHLRHILFFVLFKKPTWLMKIVFAQYFFTSKLNTKNTDEKKMG